MDIVAVCRLAILKRMPAIPRLCWWYINFSAKRHDATTIKNNIDDLSKPKVKIELNAKVTENGNALFDSNGRDI